MSQPANRDSGSVPLEEARLLDMEDFDSGTEMDPETVGTLSSSGSIQETRFTEDEDCDIQISHSNSQVSLSTSSISESYSFADNGRVESESHSCRLTNGSVDQLQAPTEAQDESDVLLTEDSPDEDSEAEVEPVQCAEKIKQKMHQKLRNIASKTRVELYLVVQCWGWLSLCREVFHSREVTVSPFGIWQVSTLGTVRTWLCVL